MGLRVAAEPPFFDATWTFEGDQLRSRTSTAIPPPFASSRCPGRGSPTTSTLPRTPTASQKESSGSPSTTPSSPKSSWTGRGRATSERRPIRLLVQLCGREGPDHADRVIRPSDCCGNPPNFMFLDATWTVDGDQLQFTDITAIPTPFATSGSRGRGSPSATKRRPSSLALRARCRSRSGLHAELWSL